MSVLDKHTEGKNVRVLSNFHYLIFFYIFFQQKMKMIIKYHGIEFKFLFIKIIIFLSCKISLYTRFRES